MLTIAATSSAKLSASATYMFTEPDAQTPFRRLPTYGFRCASLFRPPSNQLTAAVAAFRGDTAGRSRPAMNLPALPEHLFL